MAYLEGAEINNVFKGKTLSSESYDAEFTGTGSYQEACDMMLQGDRANAEKIKAAILKNVRQAAVSGTKTRQISAVCGGTVNVPATLIGLPKSMKRVQKIKLSSGSKVISICYNNSASADVTAGEKIEVSAALVSAVAALEKKGYRVNLYTGCAAYLKARGDVEYIANFVKVKDSGQYMDFLKLAYPLINPSFQRRHSFRFRETVPGPKGGWWCGYGYTVTDAKTTEKLAREAGLNLQKIVTFYDLKGLDAETIAERLLA